MCLPCDPEILCFQKKVADPEAQSTLESHLLVLVSCQGRVAQMTRASLGRRQVLPRSRLAPAGLSDALAAPSLHQASGDPSGSRCRLCSPLQDPHQLAIFLELLVRTRARQS